MCDNAASYAKKKQVFKKEEWQSITDKSGRGYKQTPSALTHGTKKPRERIMTAENLDN